MNKRIFSLFLMVLVAVSALALDTQVQEAQALANRLSPRLAQKVEFKHASGKTDYFTLANKGDKVLITANNANSMAVGLNHYLKKYCKTTVSWYADVAVDLPDSLPGVDGTESVKARVPQRFFLNYCTFGYTLPFYDWHDWERVIDWMALNGVNEPLAITGQECVWRNVWKKMGMSDEQVLAYFTGPVYLPWHRMANIDGWCGPLPEEWLDGQAELQKQILARERALNMRPVLPAFAGHVPKELVKMYPNADIKPLTAWDDFDPKYQTVFLNSEDPLYAKIQKLYLEEQTQLFGTDHIYGIDLFNEMLPPSFDLDYLYKVSKHVYESLKAVDKKAEWLQMGWFLYNERKYWTPECSKAILTGVPQGKMTMLDYFCERMEIWRTRDKFYGQPYIWCYLGNFGGNSDIQGNMKRCGERIDSTFMDGGKNFVGIGSTLEGFDVQQYPYEYIFDKAWDYKGSETDFVNEVADRHAGKVSEPNRKAWNIIYNDVLTYTPGSGRGPAAIGFPMFKKLSRRNKVRYNVPALFDAWTALTQQDAVTTDAGKIDLIWTGRQLVGDLFGYEKVEFDSAYAVKDTIKMHEKMLIMQEILTDVDKLNSLQPYCTVDKWIEQARDLGKTDKIKDYYEMNARRLITTWGGDLNDYACRNYGGLVANYYAKRWQIYFDEAFRSIRAGEEFNDKARRQLTYKMEYDYAEVTGETFPKYSNLEVLTFSRNLATKYATELQAWLNSLKK